MVCALFLTVLVGLVIPSAVIKSSPQEFYDILNPFNPLWYVMGTACIAVGLFILWLGVFYWIAGKDNRGAFDIGMWAVVVIAAVDYMFFGRKLGVLINTLQFERGLSFPSAERTINIVLVLLICYLAKRTYSRVRKYIVQAVGVAALALFIMAGTNIYGISTSLAQVSAAKTAKAAEIPQFSLSRQGKNVIVIMLDRAMGEYIPYFIAEKPELKEMYAGFTY